MPTLARTSRVRPWERNGSSIARPSASATTSRLLDGGADRQQHGELVAADAGHEVGAGHGGLQARADLAQQAVARGVAERVVELLEVVEVDQQQRELGLDRAGRGRGLVELGEQLAAVGQARQRVVHGVVLALGDERAQLVLELAAVGRVTHVEHEALDAVVVQAVGRDDVEVAVAALAVGEAQRQVAGVLGLPVGGVEVAVERGPVVRVDEVMQASADDVVGRVAEDVADRLRLPADALVGADDRDDVGGVLDDRIELALGDLRGAQRGQQGLAHQRDQRHRDGAGDVALELRDTAAVVGGEHGGHPQPPASERAQRAAVDAAEHEAEQRQERVAAGDGHDRVDDQRLERLEREREAPAAVPHHPVSRQRERRQRDTASRVATGASAASTAGTARTAPTTPMPRNSRRNRLNGDLRESEGTAGHLVH